MKSYQVNHLCLHSTYTIIVHSKKRIGGDMIKGVAHMWHIMRHNRDNVLLGKIDLITWHNKVNPVLEQGYGSYSEYTNITFALLF